jgi:hypothetical protein
MECLVEYQAWGMHIQSKLGVQGPWAMGGASTKAGGGLDMGSWGLGAWNGHWGWFQGGLGPCMGGGALPRA